MTTILLLNIKQLADHLGRSRGYVTAMKRAGYRMHYGTKTTLDHALKWLEENPEFRTTDHIRSHTSDICD